MILGQYEQVVEKALESLSSGPWTATDLVRARESINDEFCSMYDAECRSSAVLDWLRSLDQREQEELLVWINAHWSERQGS